MIKLLLAVPLNKEYEIAAPSTKHHIRTVFANLAGFVICERIVARRPEIRLPFKRSALRTGAISDETVKLPFTDKIISNQGPCHLISPLRVRARPLMTRLEKSAHP